MTAAGDSRRVPAREGRSESRERGSRFLAFAFRAPSEEAARTRVLALEKEFHDATHVCFAWRIGSVRRAADAGEPAGTAGKPILSAIDAAEVDEAAVAVVRWFGGTKLGTAGLARCYREAARAALAAAGSEEIFERDDFEIETGYENVSAVRRLVDPPSVVLADESFTDRARFRLSVRRSRAAGIQRALEEARIAFRRPRP
ncbi:MAG TPA: YigZ family protein [Thermoanaerobaculia bacterium]|nr:YigZ family protein [Thermoanaerobaculia bacterium]